MKHHNRYKRIFGLLAVFVVALAAFVPESAKADSAYVYDLPSISKAKGNMTAYLKPKSSHYNKAYAYNLGPKDKVSGVKVSNSKVAEVRYQNYDKPQLWEFGNKKIGGQLIIWAKKKGTTTITYKLNGKTRKIKLTVKSYVNPVKKLTIGSTNYASKFKSSDRLITKISKLQGKKITVTPASGWKIKVIHYGTQDGNDVASMQTSNKKTLPKKNLATVFVEMQNKKNGDVIQLGFYNKTS